MNIKYYVQIMATVIVCGYLTGCGIISGFKASSFSGVIREADSERPIPDVLIGVNWDSYNHGSFCFHSQSAITDNDGRYVIPYQSKVLVPPNGNVEISNIEPYKKGYKRILGYRGNNFNKYDLYMALDTSTSSERLTYLYDMSRWLYCVNGAAGDSIRNLFPFFRAILDESLALAKSKKEMKKVLYICDYVAQAATRKLEMSSYRPEVFTYDSNYYLPGCQLLHEKIDKIERLNKKE